MSPYNWGSVAIRYSLHPLPLLAPSAPPQLHHHLCLCRVLQLGASWFDTVAKELASGAYSTHAADSFFQQCQGDRATTAAPDDRRWAARTVLVDMEPKVRQHPGHSLGNHAADAATPHRLLRRILLLPSRCLPATALHCVPQTGHLLRQAVGPRQQQRLVLRAWLLSCRPERQRQQLGPWAQQVWPSHGACCAGPGPETGAVVRPLSTSCQGSTLGGM